MNRPDATPQVRLAGFLLAALTLLVYWPLRQHEFINFDDGLFVTENPVVQAGLTWRGIVWAFTEAPYSCPLVYVSHMVDVELFDLEAGGHHSMSALFHLANTLLLFAVLRRFTGALWPSAWVAALFAWHPMHVQSVAWIAERRDVLSTLFGLLALWSYASFADRPGWRRGVPVFVFLLLGLLVKQMLITLPFVLLLLDVWPLGRLKLDPGWMARARPLVLEKLPFFALALAFTAAGLLSAQRGGLLPTDAELPLGARIGNAFVAYWRYLELTVWPEKLAILYPHPGRLPLGQVALAAAALGGVTWWTWRERGTRPWLLVGWLWFVGTLVPVIGIIQGGQQALADRYSYVPHIGFFVMLAWAGAEVVAKWPAFKRPVVIAAAMSAAICLAATSWQLKFWKDSLALFTRAVQVTTDNHVARNNLADALAAKGRHDEALTHYREALRLRPANPVLLNNTGMALLQTGQTTQAMEHFRAVIQRNPADADAHYNLGLALAAQDKLQEAAAAYLEAIRRKPSHAPAHNNLGGVLLMLGRNAEASKHLGEAVRLDPRLVEARLNLAQAFARTGQFAPAADQLMQFLALRPDSVEALWQLAQVFAKLGRGGDARAAIDRATAIAESAGRPEMAAEFRRRGEQLLAQPGTTNAPKKSP